MKNEITQIMIIALRVITWLAWCSSVIGVISYLVISVIQFESGLTDINTESWFKYLILSVCIIATVEILISIALKHYLLARPKRRGTYNQNTLLGALRFLVVHHLNFVIANSIAIYGIVLSIQSEHMVFIYIFGLVWLSLMLFHIPRWVTQIQCKTAKVDYFLYSRTALLPLGTAPSYQTFSDLRIE